MHKRNNIKFNCIEITQPIGTFYIGVMNYSELVKISYSDIRRLELDRDVERYLGIQRPLSPTRVSELRDYVNLVDATFPTGVILAVSSENLKYNRDKLLMEIKEDGNVAKILDGQHRIAGLQNYSGTPQSFQINVVIFVDMDIEDQAMVFSTINLKQEKVNKSLAYDLYTYAKTRSPQKTCHNIAKLLNSKQGSPFLGKLRILGRANGNTQQSITQATFVESLIKYISPKPAVDRDDLKRGRKLKDYSNRRLIFRPFFTLKEDAKIAAIIWNYFGAVEERWSKAWNDTSNGLILNKSTGFIALMRLLPEAYLHLITDDKLIPTKIEFKNLFDKVVLSDKDFTREKFVPGTGGQVALYKELKNQIGI